MISFPVNGPNVGIVGTGSYLPAKEVTNRTVAAWVGVTEEEIVHKTGIHRRWYAADHEATSDLALRAAHEALADAGVAAEDLGAIIVATATPDHPQPATACRVQYGLGATQAAAFDVNAVCSGFIAALMTASQLVLASAAQAPRHALVIGADVFSRILDRSDRKTALLFGDGAGAVVLGPTPPGTGLMAADLISYGQHYGMIQVEARRKPNTGVKRHACQRAALLPDGRPRRAGVHNGGTAKGGAAAAVHPGHGSRGNRPCNPASS